MRKKLFGGSQDEAIIDADDMSKKENVVLKLKSVLEISSKKFGDTYKDVKIPMATAALLQLVNQAKAQQTEEFRRDRLYRESGTIVTAKGTFVRSFVHSFVVAAVVVWRMKKKNWLVRIYFPINGCSF